MDNTEDINLTNKAKPCPFCGSTDIRMRRKGTMMIESEYMPSFFHSEQYSDPEIKGAVGSITMYCHQCGANIEENFWGWESISTCEEILIGRWNYRPCCENRGMNPER